MKPIIYKFDKKNKFKAYFNTTTGFYVRSGVLDENNKDTNIDPFMAEYPELIDVGIMGHCIHGSSGLCIKSGVECYQNGLNIHKPNMMLKDFKNIVDQCKNRGTFQLALGGRGDPEMHEDIIEILNYCVDNNIVPNFTTSGLGLTENIVKQLKGLVGAVAISWYRTEYTIKAIDLLLKYDIKTNIHYVISNNSLDEAIEKITDSQNSFPIGVNAIVFLLHKPVGLGSPENVLEVNDPKVRNFFKLIGEVDVPFKLGFDSCCIPGLLNCTKGINPQSFDTCEGGRFSMYIDSELNAVPCSFDQKLKYVISLKKHSIEDAWNSSEFDVFRNSFKNSCPKCKDQILCMGGCPLNKEIVLCDRKEKN